MSHSHVEEWISGSFIQSHWPCMTLWPISMFSMILATPRVAVPAHHAERSRAGGQHQPAGHLEGALGGDGAADVARVAFTAGVFDVLADRVELDGQALDVGVGQVRECRYVGDCHRSSLPSSYLR